MVKPTIRVNRDKNGNIHVKNNNLTGAFINATIQAYNGNTNESVKTVSHALVKHQEKKLMRKARKTTLGRIAIGMLK